MTWSCIDCGAEFSSETEYREHQTWEFVKKAADANGHWFQQILTQLLMTNIYLVAERENLSWDKALERYDERLNQMFDHFHKGKS